MKDDFFDVVLAIAGLLSVVWLIVDSIGFAMETYSIPTTLEMEFKALWDSSLALLIVYVLIKIRKNGN